MERITKKKIHINGILLKPVCVGERALISHDGQTTLTSTVVEVFGVDSYGISFETLNSLYRVEYMPTPISAIFKQELRVLAA